MEYFLSNYFQVYWNDIYYDDRIFGIKRLYVLPINWITFFVVCVIAGFAGCIVNFFVLLNHTERSIMKNKIMARVRK